MDRNLRIVSLIASSTEIVCALGMRQFMVGRSHECDYPPDVSMLPILTAPKFEPDGTSYQIDQKVKAILQEAVSVYRVDADKLDQLAPTHIITQSQCEVCAVSLADVQAAACKLIHSQPEIVSCKPDCLEDIFEDMLRIGRSLGIEPRAQALVHKLRIAMQEIEAKAANLKNRPRVACVEWIDPLMAAGNWMPELIEMAGGINLYGEAGKHSQVMKWQTLVSDDPDVIIVTPCGFDIERTLQDMHFMTVRSGWQSLKAVANKKVFVADGNQYYNRPGPRVLESLQITAEILHPDVFAFGHETRGWRRFESASASESLA